MRKILFIAVAVLELHIFCSCRTDVEPEAGFADKTMLKDSPEETVLRREWFNPEADISKYNAIIVVPPRMDTMIPYTTMEKTEFTGFGDKAFAELGGELNQIVRKAVEDSWYFKLADKPGPGVMVLETAVIRAIPNKPIYEAWTLVVFPFFISIPLDHAMNAVTDDAYKARVALEFKAYDSVTKQPLFMSTANDKKYVCLFNFLNFTCYGNVRQRTHELTSGMLRKLSEPKTTVEEVPRFKLLNFSEN